MSYALYTRICCALFTDRREDRARLHFRSERAHVNISKRSWHYWVYTKVCPKGYAPETSVCNYWATVVVVPIIMLLVAPLFYGVFLPAALLVGYFEDRWKKGLCPFGRVNFQ